MKKRNIVAVTGAMLLLAACIPSVHPFYTEKDIVFEPRLLGEWAEKDKPDDPQSWRFEKADEKAYKLVITEGDGKRGDFEAHLFKLKDQLFLDLVATDMKLATNQADLVGASLIAGHLLLRVPQLEPSLQLALTDPDWLEKYLEAHPESIAHLKEQKRIVLTAPTRDLQAFVLKHLGKDELFGQPGEMTKKAGGAK